MLKSHNRYRYSAITQRPDYSWPNGSRLAIHVCLNLEHWPFGEGLGNDLGGASPKPNHRGFAWRDYGNRVGVWRLHQLAEELGLPVAVLLNSEVYDYCPEVVAAYRERGDEIVGHGRTNAERQCDMSPEEERRCISDATAAIIAHEGRAPTGWLGPSLSQSYESLDLLKAAGYRYMMDWPCDDQPIWFKTEHGPILSVPYPLDVNDSMQMLTRLASPVEFADALIGNFDEMYEQSQRQPLVMGIALHGHILGQPYRLREFRRAMRHIVSYSKNIWLTHPGEICRYIESLPEGIVPQAY